MSLDELRAVQAAHAFNDAPNRYELGEYHVPFQDLVPAHPEGALITSAHRRERIAVVGESGAGKSSLIYGSLGPLDPVIAPIVMSVAIEPREVISEPAKMFAFIAREIVRQARAAELLTDESADAQLTRTTPDRRVGMRPGRARRFGFSLLGVQANLDLTKQYEERSKVERSASEALANLAQMLDIVRQPGGLTPVLVFDDSDRWLRDADETTRKEFYGRLLPALRELSCALVVAIHPMYLRDAELRDDIERALQVRIDVPRLPDVAALASILESRTEVHCEIDLAAVMDASALARLFELYSSGIRHELRGILKTAHVALTDACDAGAPVITARHIDAANALWDAP